jgi:hypothetical protein
MLQPKTALDYAAELRTQAEALPPGPERDHLDWLIGEWDKSAGRDATRIPTVSRLGKRRHRYG